MSEGDSNLQKLLDGEFDAEQIASDPVLSSLAERIYGVTIEPITPTKGSQQPSQMTAEVTEVAPPTSLLVEVVEGQASPSAPTAPRTPNLPPVVEPQSSKKIWLIVQIIWVRIPNWIIEYGWCTWDGLWFGL